MVPRSFTQPSQRGFTASETRQGFSQQLEREQSIGIDWSQDLGILSPRVLNNKSQRKQLVQNKKGPEAVLMRLEP